MAFHFLRNFSLTHFFFVYGIWIGEYKKRRNIANKKKMNVIYCSQLRAAANHTQSHCFFSSPFILFEHDCTLKMKRKNHRHVITKAMKCYSYSITFIYFYPFIHCIIYDNLFTLLLILLSQLQRLNLRQFEYLNRTRLKVS